MKNLIWIFLGIIIQEFCLLNHVFAQKNSGVFYSTLFAKTGPYKRISGFGAVNDTYFLRDINGDGKDDAVVYNHSGEWRSAISDGIYFVNPKNYFTFHSSSTPISEIKGLMGDINGDGRQDAVNFDPVLGNWFVALANDIGFMAPTLWCSSNGAGSSEQFLADVNGDGKDDAVYFYQNGINAGKWYVCLSNGSNAFRNAAIWNNSFGQNAVQRLVGDVNGDGKMDIICFTKSTGVWTVALSSGSAFIGESVWRTNFGTDKELALVYDVDKNGKTDIVYYDNGDWWVSYSTGSSFGDYAHRWVVSNRTKNPKGGLPAPEAKLLGCISGKTTFACAISLGDWLCLDNNNKNETVDAALVDTWESWGNDYIPQIEGCKDTYDSGDPSVNDIQLKMIHDAGFTYIMFDITNGGHAWVNNRAKSFAQRIRNWNANLKADQHKMYFCVSMGMSRGLAPELAIQRLEAESKTAWDEYYTPYQDCYYQMKGKPFLVHFVWEPENSDAAKIYSGSTAMTYFNKFTIRWMYNQIIDKPKYANAYGWPIMNKSGNPIGDEVMDVSPGFWNGAVGAGRDGGELYRSHWLRVIKYQPQSVWVNSFNETWEHTSIEPSYIPPSSTIDNPSLISTWTDLNGERADDFYWNMTKQYNRLFMYNELTEGAYIQEEGDNHIYKITPKKFELQTRRIYKAPVLLLYSGFMKQFKGKIISK